MNIWIIVGVGGLFSSDVGIVGAFSTKEKALAVRKNMENTMAARKEGFDDYYIWNVQIDELAPDWKEMIQDVRDV